MSETFTKLFSSITRSSIWLEDDQTLRVWVTMLALADRSGYVGASVGGLAAMSRVDVEKTREALQKFLSPDPDSRSKEFEGRRIEVADRGWTLLNYDRFRDMRDEEARKEYERNRKKDQRAKKKRVPDSPEMSRTVPARPKMSAVSAQAEAEAEEENPPSGDTPIAPKGGKRGAARPWRRFPPEFQPTEEHRKLASELRVDLELELAKIRDFEFSRPRSDPDATLRTWIRTAAERQSRVRPVGSGNIAADNIKRQLERVKMLEEKERREAAGEAV